MIKHIKPVIASAWWDIAGMPDTGTHYSEKQQPVDFGVWQAKDGTWQLWSCIRNTECGGNSRLLYRWEGTSLTQPDWTPKGIAMMAKPELGETPGGLQSPFVIKKDDTWYMLYGDWNRMCLALSTDGKNFTRYKGENGEPALFSGPYENTRDPMVLLIDDTYYCYYTCHAKTADPPAAVFCRTSNDLIHWSDPIAVCKGGEARDKTDWYGGDCESPFVVKINDSYCLFRNQLYGKNNYNTQYISPDPLSFGINDDRYRVSDLPVAAPEIVYYEGKYYIAACHPSLKGIRMARLEWQ